MQLTNQDKELISIAGNVVRENLDLYEDIDMIVGSAVLCKSGNIYKGVNILSSHSVCAEQVAIGQALACGEREFDTIVAVKLDKDGKSRVISPCGLCRYIIDKLDMNINILVEDIDNDKIAKVKSDKLLPYPYKRESE